MRSSFLLDVVAILAVAAAVITAGLNVSEDWQHILALLMILGLFAAAFDLAFGWTGLFSIGHATFFGAGAYAYSLLTLNAGASTSLGLLGSMVAGAAVAALFGLLGTRSTGIYFSLVTLALGQIASVLVEVKLRRWTGGADGIAGVPRPDMFGVSFDSTASFLNFMGVCFALGMVCLALIRRSSFGQVLRAVRENPTRTQQLGYDVALYRVYAIALSGGFSGLAGALFSGLSFYVGPDMMNWNLSGDVLIMTVLGGAGTLFGPVVGAVVFELAKEVISGFTAHWYGFVGAMFILITLVMPSGLAGGGARLFGVLWRRIRPRPELTPAADLGSRP